MCGLIGFTTAAKTFEKNRKRYLTECLFVDTLRGFDGTGLALVQDDYKTAILKRAIPGYDFIGLKKYRELLEKREGLKVAIGHNRAATMGGKQDIHSHPFAYKDIILAHNGTLTKNTFDDFPGKDFHALKDIDSFRIAASIAENGAKETLEALRGAYALTWYDAHNKTFNLARNSQRPFSIGISSDQKELLYSSEEWILKNVAKRSHIPLKSIEDLPIGFHFVFNLEDSDFIRNREKNKYTMYYSSYGHSNWKGGHHHHHNYNNSKYFDKYGGTTAQESRNSKLKPLGLEEYNLIIGTLDKFIEAKTDGTKGTCYFKLNRKDEPIIIKALPNEVKIISYGVDKYKIVNEKGDLNIGKDYLLQVEYLYDCHNGGVNVQTNPPSKNIVCGIERLATETDKALWYKATGTTTKGVIIWDAPILVYRNQKKSKNNDSVWEDTESHNESDTTEDLEFTHFKNEDLVTRLKFEELTEEGCSWCGNPIDPGIEDGSNLVFTDQDKPICHLCIDEWNKYTEGF